MSFDKTLKKIDPRVWQDIRSKWVGYLPTFEYPGQSPESELYETYDLADIQKQAKETANNILRTEIKVLRTDILREGIYNLHKANHVCCAANYHIDIGIPTWSVSSIYQSTLFALKGFLCLLGLEVSQVNMNHLLIDCFPAGLPLSSKQKKTGYSHPPELAFINLPNLTHKQHWEILQRVLRVTSNEQWDEQLVNFLINITPDRFTYLRNSLHYKTSYWIFPKDLFSKEYPEDFGVKYDMCNNLTLEKDTKDINYFICYAILKLSFDLLEDLSKFSTAVKEEFDLMKEGINTYNSRLATSLNIA
jgi:hypothetical protein